MRHRTQFLAIFLLALVRPSSCQEPAELQEKTFWLILDLNSNHFAEREHATGELFRIGEPAVPALQRALASKHAETRLRARAILKSLGKIDLLRTSLEIGMIETGAPVELNGVFKTVHIARIAGRQQVTAADFNAEELIIDAVDGDAWVMLAGKVKKLRVGTLDGRGYVDASNLSADRVEIGSVDSAAAIRVRSLDAVVFDDPDGTRLSYRDPSGVTIGRPPIDAAYWSLPAESLRKCIAALANFLSGK
jgi:hypothetical protein